MKKLILSLFGMMAYEETDFKFVWNDGSFVGIGTESGENELV